ncbi:MAG: hypothetical protein AAF327_18100 [Cyanobacteria bacterium P01_A01_bin.37]
MKMNKLPIWAIAYIDCSLRNPGGVVQILTEPMTKEEAMDLRDDMRITDQFGSPTQPDNCYQVVPTLNLSKMWNRFWFGA